MGVRYKLNPDIMKILKKHEKLCYTGVNYLFSKHPN